MGTRIIPDVRAVRLILGESCMLGDFLQGEQSGRLKRARGAWRGRGVVIGGGVAAGGVVTGGAWPQRKAQGQTFLVQTSVSFLCNCG